VSTNVEDEDPPTQRPPGQISDDEFWLVSYAEDDDRELTTKEIVAAMKRGEITLSTLVWRDGMGEWQTISSIDELRARAGFIVQPFFTDAPPRPEAASLQAIAALAEDIEEIPSSAIQSAPPSSLAEADFLGSDDGDSSLAPPRIDHAAFFKSSPPSDDSDKKATGLPALPTLAGPKAAAAPSSAQPAQKSQAGGGLKWVLVLLTALGAAGVGFLITPAKQEAIPAKPMAKAAANPAAEPAQESASPAPAVPPTEPAVADTTLGAAGAPVQGNSAARPAAPPPTPPSTPTNPSVATSPTTATTAAPVNLGTGSPATTATAAQAKPASPPPPPRVTSTAPFDKSAASAALGQAAAKASSCRQPGDPSGTAQVEVTFSSSGRATRAIIGGPPFRGTATGSCIAQAMRTAQVPPFAGDLVTVQKRVVIQ
jgi:hypothetical protein